MRLLNATTGVPPALLAWGRVPRGPLAILKDTMTGKVELPLNFGKTASEYLEKAQQRYISRYNLRASEKSFEIGQKVLVLIPDTTSSKTFSRWVGPAVIKDRLSNHTYSVEINGSRKHIHADKIRKYHIQINEVMCDTVTTGHEQTKINHCAVIYDDDSDFGSVDVIDTDQFQQRELLPSQRIDLNTLSHLSVEQRTKLLTLLDKYSECFLKNLAYALCFSMKLMFQLILNLKD